MSWDSCDSLDYMLAGVADGGPEDELLVLVNKWRTKLRALPPDEYDETARAKIMVGLARDVMSTVGILWALDERPGSRRR